MVQRASNLEENMFLCEVYLSKEYTCQDLPFLMGPTLNCLVISENKNSFQ